METNAHVLDHAANLNVVFSLEGNPGPDPEGYARHCNLPGAPVRLLARRTGDAIRAVTGGSWSGRAQVIAGFADSRYDGWLRVTFEPTGHPIEEPGGVGTAIVGESLFLQLFLNDDCSFAAPNLLGAYLRELGHVLGFFHVPDSSWLMHRNSTRGWYAPNELLHMRKAYELGPGYPRSSPVWSLHPPGPLPGRRPPRKRNGT